MVEVIPGAEPWSSEGGPVGALVLHGFTGSPISVRPTAEALAGAGLAVELPRLPGHGTRWQDLARSRWPDWLREAAAGLEILRARTELRIVVGLSVGGLLALELAARRPDAVDGLVLVNPALELHPHPLLRAVPLLRWLIRSYPVPSPDDIARADATERGYDRVPLRALASLLDLQRRVEPERVTAPVVVCTSRSDHVVRPESSAEVLRRVGSVDREHVWLERSRHVATLDHDAPVIVERALALARRVGRPPANITPGPTRTTSAATDAREEPSA